MKKKILGIALSLALVFSLADTAMAAIGYMKVQACAIICVSYTVDARGGGHWGLGLSTPGPSVQMMGGIAPGKSVSGWSASAGAGFIVGANVTAQSGGAGIEAGLSSPTVAVGVGYTW